MAASSLPAEERPLLLLLPGPDDLAPAMRALLSHDQVRAFALPAVWDLVWGQVDAFQALRDVPRLDLGTLDALVAYLRRAGTKEALDAHVAMVWGLVSERVREWYLRRGALSVLGSIFKVSRPGRSFDPPAAFVRDRVLEARFEAAYRLHTVPGATRHSDAPPEEASVVIYPFDLADKGGRAEAGPAAGKAGAALEIFAYESGRERHRQLLEAVAAEHGYVALDPSAESPSTAGGMARTR